MTFGAWVTTTVFVTAIRRKARRVPEQRRVVQKGHRFGDMARHADSPFLQEDPPGLRSFAALQRRLESRPTAVKNHRLCIRRAGAVEAPAEVEIARLPELRSRRIGTRRIEDIASEHRARRPKPITQGPRAADLVRADRDAR
jgi:hypothetical protein